MLMTERSVCGFHMCYDFSRVLLPSGAQLEVRSAPATLVSGPSCQVRQHEVNMKLVPTVRS